MSWDLQGKVALVTGASSGIGEAIARKLAARGIHVMLAARRLDRIENIAQHIREQGGTAQAVQCDVRELDQVQAMVRATVARFGGIDILVANAGFGYRSPIVDGDPERWKAMIDTNVYGMLLTLKYGVPPIVERGAGDIFLLSSVAGQVVAAGGGAYSATKFAVNAIGEALRQEVSRKNIRVTLLAPGVVLSEFQEVAGYPPGFIENWLGGTPPVQKEDIADVVSNVLDLPRHVSINQMIIRPTGQVNP